MNTFRQAASRSGVRISERRKIPKSFSPMRLWSRADGHERVIAAIREKKQRRFDAFECLFYYDSGRGFLFHQGTGHQFLYGIFGLFMRPGNNHA